MNAQQKAALKSIAKWKPFNFPNGSSYRQQYLPTGDHRNVGGFHKITVKSEYNIGYFVTFYNFDGDVLVPTQISVPFGHASVGPGTDLGVHFCSRDQALSRLM